MIEADWAVPELEQMIDTFQGDIDEYGKGVYDVWERLCEDDDLLHKLVRERLRIQREKAAETPS